MEITPTGTPQTSNAQATEVHGRSPAHRAKHAGDPAITPRVDGSQLSEEAQALRKALEAVGDAPDVRADVVAQFRQRIASGEYTPNPDAIAGKIVDRLFNGSGS